MQIGVNLLFMVPGEVGGSEPLLTNLVQAMAEHIDLTVYAVSGFSNVYPAIAASTKVVEVPWRTSAQALRIAAESTYLQASARRRGLALVHHGVGTTPFVRATPAAVTIHDIQYKHYPQNFRRLKRNWLSVNVPYSVRNCSIITVPSQWVKQDLIERLGAPEDKVVVVPFGSEGLFGPHPAEPHDVARRYSLTKPYFIFPGRTYPHKNHIALAQAFARLRPGCELIFTGPAWYLDDIVHAEIARLGCADRIRHIGLVPRRDLAGLYAGAVALAYPTRFEGFGAPALEAMAMGCPVIASNTTAVPEVVGDSGVLLDPDDIEGWTSAMQAMMSDDRARSKWIEKGLTRAATFTWSRSAELQIDAYRRGIAR